MTHPPPASTRVQPHVDLGHGLIFRLITLHLQKSHLSAAMDYAYSALDKGYVPDAVLRPVIRQLCRNRQREIERGESKSCNAQDRPAQLAIGVVAEYSKR